MYQLDLAQGFERAGELMSPTIRADIARDIGGDHQQVHALDTRYGEIRFKHVLLTIWLSAFLFRGKTYRFVINGRTGKLQGERPYSVWKIIFAVLSAILLLGGLALWQRWSVGELHLFSLP